MPAEAAFGKEATLCEDIFRPVVNVKALRLAKLSSWVDRPPSGGSLWITRAGGTSEGRRGKLHRQTWSFMYNQRKRLASATMHSFCLVENQMSSKALQRDAILNTKLLLLVMLECTCLTFKITSSPCEKICPILKIFFLVSTQTSWPKSVLKISILVTRPIRC